MRFPCSVVYISIMHLLWYRQIMLLHSEPFAKYLITKFDEFYLVATEWRQYGILTTRTNESKNEQKRAKTSEKLAANYTFVSVGNQTMNRAYSIETRFQRENIAPIQFRMMEKC